MDRKKRVASLFAVCAVLLAPLGVFAGSEKAHYIRGTVPGMKEKTEGVTHADGPMEFQFEYKNGSLKIPFLQITKLHYGKASHLTVGYSVFMGVHPKMAHDYMMTIDYVDENQKPLTAVFLLGKDRLWNTLVNLQSKSGKTIEFEDAAACKSAMKDAPPGQIDCPTKP